MIEGSAPLGLLGKLMLLRFIGASAVSGFEGWLRLRFFVGSCVVLLIEAAAVSGIEGAAVSGIKGGRQLPHFVVTSAVSVIKGAVLGFGCGY